MAKPYEKKLDEESKFIEPLFIDLFKILKVERNPKKRGVPDMLIKYKGELVAYGELEVKRVWKDFDFPSEWRKEGVQFPKRKEKFVNTEVPTFMVMFNAKGTNGLIVDCKTMVESPSVTRWVRAGRYHGLDNLFQVPLEKVTFGLENFENYIMSKLNLK